MLRINTDKQEMESSLLDKRQLSLNSIIQTSTLSAEDPSEQNKKILDAFNAGVREDITVESILFGKRIDQNEFRLVHRNNVAQLIPWTYYPRRLGLYLTGQVEEIGVFKQTDLCIGAHGRYLINVPQGKLVKAWLGTNHPILLGEGPHVFTHPNFKLDENPLVDISSPYIEHGNYKILRVPRGQVAKVWLGSTPYILESRPEPYIFNDATFKHVKQPMTDGSLQDFSNASNRLIEHGSIKRLLPRTGEVAITYDNGELNIIEASNKPHIINSDSHSVDGFLQTAAQTLVFPSKKTQEDRRKQNPRDVDTINYEEFRTSDGLPIGVNLLVVYEITDPKTTLTRLNKGDIINHIENIVVADMGRVIQSCNSSDFQKTDQTTVKAAAASRDDAESYKKHHSTPTFYAHLQDSVKNKLAEDLNAWGINLVRLNIETPKILDKTIADEMARNSLGTAKARAEASVLGLEYDIKQQRANQEAEKVRIETERQRANKILQAQGDAESLTIRAQAELDAAKLKAESDRITYENMLRKSQLENKTSVEMTKMKNDTELAMLRSRYETEVNLLRDKASVYASNEPYRQLEIAKAQADALKGIGTSVISPEVAQTWFGSQGLGFFAPLRGAQGHAGHPNIANDAAAPKILAGVSSK